MKTYTILGIQHVTFYTTVTVDETDLSKEELHNRIINSIEVKDSDREFGDIEYTNAYDECNVQVREILEHIIL